MSYSIYSELMLTKDEVSDYRRDMAIKGQVRVNCDAKVFDGSYRYYVFTKERYGDVTRQLRDKLPHPNQEKHGFLRIDQKVVSATLR